MTSNELAHIEPVPKHAFLLSDPCSQNLYQRVANKKGFVERGSIEPIIISPTYDPYAISATEHNHRHHAELSQKYGTELAERMQDLGHALINARRPYPVEDVESLFAQTEAMNEHIVTLGQEIADRAIILTFNRSTYELMKAGKLEEVTVAKNRYNGISIEPVVHSYKYSGHLSHGHRVKSVGLVNLEKLERPANEALGITRADRARLGY